MPLILGSSEPASPIQTVPAVKYNFSEPRCTCATEIEPALSRNLGRSKDDPSLVLVEEVESDRCGEEYPELQRLEDEAHSEEPEHAAENGGSS